MHGSKELRLALAEVPALSSMSVPQRGGKIPRDTLTQSGQIVYDKICIDGNQNKRRELTVEGSRLRVRGLVWRSEVRGRRAASQLMAFDRRISSLVSLSNFLHSLRKIVAVLVHKLQLCLH